MSVARVLLAGMAAGLLLIVLVILISTWWDLRRKR